MITLSVQVPRDLASKHKLTNTLFDVFVITLSLPRTAYRAFVNAFLFIIVIPAMYFPAGLPEVRTLALLRG